MNISLSKVETDVKESFVKVGQTMEIFPIFSRKRSICLNRKRFSIRFEKGYDMNISIDSIVLPCLGSSSKEYLLEVIEVNGSSCYELSGKNCFFELNGNYCSKAFIQYGDTVKLEKNILKFPLKKKEINRTLDISLVVIKSDLSILLEGPTGVGKSSMAKRIHNESGRVGDFVQLNLSAMPAGLIESELFGHAKGAFTGAISNKDGAIKSANRGTLFIDEVDSLTKDLQVKLLLFLDNQKFRPVGSNIEVKSDVRLVFASGRRLKSLVSSGEMRADFFYRINSGVNLNLKPLRDDPKRLVDIVKDYERTNGVLFSKRYLSFLNEQAWPGNVRQLLSHLDKKRILSKTNRICMSDEDLELISDIELFKEDIKPLKLIKKEYIRKCYYFCQKDVVATAKRLGVSVNTVKNNLIL